MKLPVVVETSVFVMLRQFESELVKVGRVKPDWKAGCLVKVVYELSGVAARPASKDLS